MTNKQPTDKDVLPLLNATDTEIDFPDVAGA